MRIYCFDVGGTHIRFGNYLNNRLTEHKKERTQQHFLYQIREITKKAKEHTKPSAISVVVPGPVHNGVLLKAPPLNMNEPIDVKKGLADLCEEIIVENDLNAAAQAENRIGAGTRYKNFYLLTLSTGIGAGVIINGEPLKGLCCEFGHNLIETSEEYKLRCNCQRSGCWAALASGNGIKNLSKIVMGKEKSPEEIFKLAHRGNSKAKDLVARIRDYNARGIGTMLNSYAVDLIVVMGSIGLKQFDKVIPLDIEISNYTIHPVPKILKTELGDDIGLYGAHILAKEKLKH